MSTRSGAVGSGDSSAAKKLIITHSPWRMMWLGLCCVALVVALAPEADGFKIVGGLLVRLRGARADCRMAGHKSDARRGRHPQALRQRALLHAVAQARHAGPDIGHHLHVEIARTGARRAARFARRQNFDAVPEPRDKTGVFRGDQGFRAQNQHLPSIIGGRRRLPLNQSFSGPRRRRNGKARQNAAPRSASKNPSARSHAKAAVRRTPTAIPLVKPPVLARASNRLGERPGTKFCSSSNRPLAAARPIQATTALAPADIAQRDEKPGPRVSDKMFGAPWHAGVRSLGARNQREDGDRRDAGEGDGARKYSAREMRFGQSDNRRRRRRRKIGATAAREPGLHRFATLAAYRPPNHRRSAPLPAPAARRLCFAPGDVAMHSVSVVKANSVLPLSNRAQSQSPLAKASNALIANFRPEKGSRS